MNRQRILGVLIGIVACVMITGCAASDESANSAAAVPPPPSATEAMQKEMADLKAENVSLKEQTTKLQQESGAATARAAELETQLADIRAKLAAVPPKPKFTDPRAEYENAVHLFRTKTYAEAQERLSNVLATNIPMTLQDNCHYWLGECAYAQKDFTGAIEHFQRVFTFTQSEKKDDAQIMIANSYFAMGDKTRAKAEYKKFLERFPASPYAKRAKERLARF